MLCFQIANCRERMESTLKAGYLQSHFSCVGMDSCDERELIFKCSDLDLTGLFIPTLEGAQDLALPLSECVKVETHNM